MTKLEMSRTIVQALYNLPAPPAVDHREVVRRAQRGTVASLTHQYGLAIKALRSVGKEARS